MGETKVNEGLVMWDKIVNFTITSKEKAIAAFISSAVGSYLIQNGLTIKDIHSVHALQALLVGVATHQFVYWTTNK